jgi:HK97 family phage prohead protease
VIRADIDGMTDAEFMAYSTALCQKWEDERREKLAAQERASHEAKAEEARRALPKDWHRTFRGIAADLDRAREQLARSGVFTDTHRIIEGIASTPEGSSNGLALLSTGCEVELPVPLLQNHDWRHVIGEVIEIKCSEAAVTFKARVANAVLPGIDDVWQEIISGEVAGISIDSSHYGDARYENGTRIYHRWRLCELSVCTRGANPDARILRAFERTAEREIVHREAGLRAAAALPRHAPVLAPSQQEPATPGADSDLAARVAALEVRGPGMTYRGVWNADQQFNEGDVVTDHGSAHYCLRSTRDRPPSHDWQLCVKRGDRAKDAYQIARDEGFLGTRKEWVDSLVKPDRK